jgi:protein involved in polysaccharide export with SLBB domain
MLSREDLTELLQEYQAALASPAYSGRMKGELQAAAERVQERLAHGDFQPGDRVVLYVQGQPNLPDTVPVEPGPSISLPLFGQISLDGVLRSEISEHLTKELGRMIRDPVVRAQGLMRLSVQGDVGRPGFYTVPTDILVSEALMMAGGPGRDSNLEDLRIERGSKVLYGGQELQTAMRAGRTLDQLSLQAGDQIMLPAKSRSNIWGTVLRYGIIIGSTFLLGVRVVG